MKVLREKRNAEGCADVGAVPTAQPASQSASFDCGPRVATVAVTAPKMGGAGWMGGCSGNKVGRCVCETITLTEISPSDRMRAALRRCSDVVSEGRFQDSVIAGVSNCLDVSSG